MGRFIMTLVGTHKRQKLVVLSAIIILSVMELSGIFSYFYGRDMVSNRLVAKNAGIALVEPDWDKTGQNMAASVKPGMEIPKNPFAVNTGQSNLYIRLKLTIEVAEYSGNLVGTDDETTGYVGIPTDQKRLKAIAESLRYVKGTTEEEFLVLSEAGGTGSVWNIQSCANSRYYADPTNYSTDSKKLIFYFYYTGDNTGTGSEKLMKTVGAQMSTTELFSRLDVPVYKKDYLGVFDQSFLITVEAEGIPAINVLTAEQAKTVFAAN